MNNRKAFTIVELVIVIAVIAILAAVLIPTFSTVVRKAKDSYILQNDRNELLQNYLDSVLEGEGWTAPTKEIKSEIQDDDGIGTLKKDLSAFLGLVGNNIMYDDYYLGGAAVRAALLENDDYQLVEYWGSGVVRVVFSCKEKYNITFVDGLGHLSDVKIRLYDDINTSSGESVYYGLKANKKDSADGENDNSEYEIEVVKYVESQN